MSTESPCPYGCGKLISAKGMAMHLRYCPNAPMMFPGRPGGYGKLSTCLVILVLLFIAPKAAWDAVQAAIAGTTFALNVGSKATSTGLEGLRLGIDSWRPDPEHTAETYFEDKLQGAKEMARAPECSLVSDPEHKRIIGCEL